MKPIRPGGCASFLSPTPEIRRSHLMPAARQREPVEFTIGASQHRSSLISIKSHDASESSSKAKACPELIRLQRAIEMWLHGQDETRPQRAIDLMNDEYAYLTGVLPIVSRFPEVENAKELLGLYPLEFRSAAEGGDVGVIRSLMHKVDIDGRNRYGQTALIIAAMYGKIEVVHELLQAKASVNLQDFSARSAISYALSIGRQDIVLLLREHHARLDGTMNQQ